MAASTKAPAQREASMMLRVAIGVPALWLIIAGVLASQSVLGGNLQGNAMPAGAAIRAALVQTVPWIPVTLIIVALASRFPVKREVWRRHLPIHLVAFPLLVFLENALVVLAFWVSSGNYGDVRSLAASARFWTLMRLHVAALVYLAIAALTQAIGYYRDSRDRELRLANMETQLSRARLDALTARIRPHFLFNTLHTIGHLWRSGRADEADAMLDHLGTLFQHVHDSTERTLVSLDEEMQTVLAYLAIESVRFSDRLRIVSDIEDRARDCAVPPLLLQPLVENAVRHGIAASSSAGRIRIAAKVEGARLHITIDDDGPGLNALASARGSGTGLRNTRERLEQIFGPDHSFVIDSDRNGTHVRIDLPDTGLTASRPTPAVTREAS